MSKKLTLPEIESAVALIANALFNEYNPTVLKTTVSKYYKIIKDLNEIEKILDRA